MHVSIRSIVLVIIVLVLSCEEYFSPVIEGCTIITACNYDATATIDDGNCVAPQGCNEWCEGHDGAPSHLDCNYYCGPSSDGTSLLDTGISECLNPTYQTAETCTNTGQTIWGQFGNDECGVCGGSGIADGACDCAGNVLDECDVCGGAGIAADKCDCAGNVLDECGICDGDGPNEGFDCDENCIADFDCEGTCGGSVVKDACGVCGGDSLTCTGCMIDSACNFDGNATIQCDDCCDYAEENYDCNDICTSVLDCIGMCGGIAVEDACGVCCGGTTNIDCTENEDSCECDNEGDIRDCEGTCGGSVIDDACGVCGGDGSTCTGCMIDSACNFDENATIQCDDCCDYAEEYHDCNDICTAVLDCVGVCGGIAVLDDCGICTGIDNYVSGTCNDCAGIPNGTAELDDCGVCSGGDSGHQSNSDKDDCDVCFGDANLVENCVEGDTVYEDKVCSCELDDDNQPLKCDQCGICGGTGVPELNEAYEVMDDGSICDCSGEPNGNAINCLSNENVFYCSEEVCPCSSGIYDECEWCNGSGANSYQCCQFGDLAGLSPDGEAPDCAGYCGGEAIEDDCGICSGGNTGQTANYFKDCNGDCMGYAYEDSCGDCVGGTTGEDECETGACTDWQADNFICDTADAEYGDMYKCCQEDPNDPDNNDQCLIRGNGSYCADECSLINEGSDNEGYLNGVCCYMDLSQTIDTGCGNESGTCCEYLGCTDPTAANYDENANTDDGTCQDCVTLTLNDAYNIEYDSVSPIFGFQFDVVAGVAGNVVEVTGAGGGAAEAAGFTVSTGNNTVIGFSLAGTTIPAGVGVLVDLETDTTPFCVANIILSSDALGNALFNCDDEVGTCP